MSAFSRQIRPSFLRFPGGCIVEDFTRETAYRFEDRIGPVWDGNSFDAPEKVIPNSRYVSVDDSILRVSARSVNVFRAGIG